MKKVWRSQRAGETRRLGEDMARCLLSSGLKRGVVMGLVGDLGSGKTVFVQGLAKGLGVRGRIASPTFIIARSYAVNGSEIFERFHHIDLYRLGDEDIEVQFLEELLEDEKGIVVIEWADKVKKILPSRTIWLIFSQIDRQGREIKVEGKEIDALVD